MGEYETGPEAKQRLISEIATKGELGLKLCERHYFQHVEGSGACVVRTAEQFYDFLDELPERLDEESDILASLVDQLEEVTNETD